MARKALEVALSNADVNSLTILSNSTQNPILARRASVILECAKGHSNKEVSMITGMNEMDVGRWRKAFIANGIDALRGKRKGGNTRPDAPDEAFYKHLDELLKEDDKNWTVKDLVQETGSTVSIVSAALRKRGINLQRQRQWVICTNDELISKTVDVIGLYLSKAEQGMIVRCSQDKLPECRGELVTRNRELAEDYLHYDGNISLTDAINTAVHRVKETSHLVPVTLSEFLNRTIAAFPTEDGYEYHILLCSSESKGYKGDRLKDIYQFWADNPEQWLKLVHNKVNELADHSQLNSISGLKNALDLYLEKCIETTAPLIWRKRLIQPEEVGSSSDQDACETDNDIRYKNGSESSPFLDELRDLFQRYMTPDLQNPDAVKCGFISFAYDQEEVRVRIEDDHGTMPDAACFDFSTLESFSEGMTAIEKCLINTRNRAGVHAAEMTADLLKKKRSRLG